MENKRTSVLNNALIWFGAGVSIAEIFTGTLIAPLGFPKGILSIISGHFIGCVLLFLVGLIGAKHERSAMDTVKMSFGEHGAKFFAILNVLQLVGWTAIMIIQGARATGVIANPVMEQNTNQLWCVIIGVLLLIWVFLGIRNIGKLNTVVMSMLFILTAILSIVLFSGNAVDIAEGGISFGAAVELSVAMPISWLPVISDYTKDAKKPLKATLASTVTYFMSSSWMYILGMGAVIFAGSSDIAEVMIQTGLGLAGVIILIASTVTSTYLDAFSAGISTESITKKFNSKTVAIITVILGVILAIFTPIEKFEDFLYLIGSVFAPMAAIQIVGFFMKRDCSIQNFNIKNLIIWFIGFLIYRCFMQIDTPFGYTLPALLIVGGISFLSEVTAKK